MNQENKTGTAAAEKTKTAAASKTGSEKTEEKESMLEKFFFDQLKDIYYAEQQIQKALPKMAEAATTEELKEAFSDHLHITGKHIKSLKKLLPLRDRKRKEKNAKLLKGL